MDRKSLPLERTGGFKELVILFLPIALTTFSTCLYLLVEKLLLGRLSATLMEAALSATYPCQIFQGFCVALSMIALVWVGKWYGAKEWQMIGPGIWQFIWFSFLSMLITFPLGLLYGRFYFNGTSIEETVWPYYIFLMSINFLYPLGMALSCFYLAQGKTSLVLWTTIGSQAVKLIFAYLLIFGWEDWIPSLGLMGGAFSTLIAQGGFCLLLLWFFLDSKYGHMRTREWNFQPKLFFSYTYPGLLRAITRVLTFACWASIAQLMVEKGEDYLLILSIGGILSLFLPFLGEALCQAQTTVVSQILGAKNDHMLNKAFKSGAILSFLIIIITSLPLVMFPLQIYKFLYPSITLNEETIRLVFLGVWISYAFFTSSYVPISYILAFKDLKFSLFMGFFNWINGFLLMYVAIEKFEILPNQFWLVLSLMHASSAIIYYWRMKWLIRKNCEKTSLNLIGSTLSPS
jgi:MATE family multidrug resistance protein